MPPSERDPAYLWDMREAVQLALSFVKDIGYHEYAQNRLIQSAVERQIEIVGEAARHVSLEFQQAHPEIPWRSIIGLRNLLIHEYGEIKQERV